MDRAEATSALPLSLLPDQFGIGCLNCHHFPFFSVFLPKGILWPPWQFACLLAWWCAKESISHRSPNQEMTEELVCKYSTFFTSWWITRRLPRVFQQDWALVITSLITKPFFGYLPFSVLLLHFSTEITSQINYLPLNLCPGVCFCGNSNDGSRVFKPQQRKHIWKRVKTHPELPNYYYVTNYDFVQKLQASIIIFAF